MTQLLRLMWHNFDHFPLFDETLRHRELCNSVISTVTYSEIQQSFANMSENCRPPPLSMRVHSDRSGLETTRMRGSDTNTVLSTDRMWPSRVRTQDTDCLSTWYTWEHEWINEKIKTVFNLLVKRQRFALEQAYKHKYYTWLSWVYRISYDV